MSSELEEEKNQSHSQRQEQLLEPTIAQKARITKLTKANWERPSWDDYFMEIVEAVSHRSNCLTRQVGSVVISPEHRIISTGYNGTPRNTKNCNEGGCPRCLAKITDPQNYKSAVDLGECLCSHAEENAVTQAALHGVKIAGGTIYGPMIPCIFCSKLIVNSGIVEVVYKGEEGWEGYVDMGKVAYKLFMDAGVRVRCLNEEFEVKG